MTEPREPYIAGRKKVVTVKIELPAYLKANDFELDLNKYLRKLGYNYKVMVEVSYEEEGK